jgi:hypothetical protein
LGAYDAPNVVSGRRGGGGYDVGGL